LLTSFPNLKLFIILLVKKKNKQKENSDLERRLTESTFDRKYI
jgi:hypothetical protein